MNNNEFHAYFGFLTEPFTREISAKALYVTDQLKSLFARLQQLLRRRGIALITGEVGCGKSTAMRAFAETLEKTQTDWVYIDDPTLGTKGLFNSIASQLDLNTRHFKWQLMASLKASIEKSFHDYSKTTVIVIDEAQLLKPHELEELRLFTNFKIDSHSPLSLILLAHPEFTKLVRLKSLQAFSQRLVLRAHLTGLTQNEALHYVKHHLEVAGRTDPLFTDDVITEIYQQAKGLPRLINTLCYDCLYETYLQNKNLVDMPTLEKVLLNYEEL
ncbi:MAG: ExeA family protein [Planctomycetota bacterium]|jgi:type II secretory pathway predicted ATPase ExeA